MKFNNLEEKCLYYRSLTDYKLLGNEYMLIMLDGRSFSKRIKKKFELPFDDKFIDAMNKTAEYLCKNIQGAKFAFVQSDEISILVTDFDTPETDSYFGNRLCKIQSIVASMAATKFSQLVALNELVSVDEDKEMDIDIYNYIEDMPLYEFDCKAWVVPNKNEAFAWFLYRQNDCIRNSKLQAAQTYLSYNELLNKTADEQIQLLKDKNGICWETEYEWGKKYGRFIVKELVEYYDDKTNSEYSRNRWFPKALGSLNENPTSLLELIPENI